MRPLLGLFAGLLLTVAVTGLASAEPTKSIELRADNVSYYSDRFVVTADGHVRAQLSDGTVVSGETFSMDLKANRYLIAGNVHLDGPRAHETGAAFAGFADLDRNYLLTADPVPDRWTYFGLDFAKPYKGRQQPGDAFDFSDVTGLRPYVVADRATIFLRNNVVFPAGARLNQYGLYVPTPGYVITFSANPNFYQNGFQGAVFDIAEPFAASANSLSAAHLRYDQTRGFYTAFDQHFVHDTDYAVFSIDPVTQNQRQTNLILYKRFSPALEVRTFTQLSTLSQGFSQPKDASAFTNVVVNSRVGRYAVSLVADQFYDYLLAPPANAFLLPGENGYGHPVDVTLNVQSFQNEFQLFRSLGVPLKFQYRGGYGYNYDSLGLQTITGPTFGGALYTTIWKTYLGLTAFTNPVRIAKLTSLSAKADTFEEWYSLPHHTVTTDTSVSLSRTPLTAKQPSFVVTYDVLNIGDFYGAQQRTAYPLVPGNDTISNQFGTFTGLNAFDGFATSRSISAGIVYAPVPRFTFNLTIQHFDVTPRPVPGVGGEAPYQVTGDVRVRLNKLVQVDLTRSYYFNFANETWSPQWGIQFSP
jgi:hypothetical protein